MLQSAGNLVQRGKCWKEGNFPKSTEIELLARNCSLMQNQLSLDAKLTDFASSCSFLPVIKF